MLLLLEALVLLSGALPSLLLEALRRRRLLEGLPRPHPRPSLPPPPLLPPPLPPPPLLPLLLLLLPPPPPLLPQLLQ